MKDYGEQIVFEKKRGRVKKLFFAAVLLVLLLGGAAVYVRFFTGLLFFKEIRVSGLSNVKKEDLFPAGKPVYLFGDVHISNPLVASFSAEKDYISRILSVKVEERTLYAIWCVKPGENQECFWFDKTGMLIASAPATEGVLIKGVYDLSGRKLAEGDYVLDEAFRANLFKIFSVIDAAGVAVIGFQLESPQKQELAAFAESGAKIFFSLRLDPRFALEPLKSLKEKLSTLEYIDFRSENRVFYK